MNTIRSTGDCCSPCASPLVVTVPGKAGTPGVDGDVGAAGVNAFTYLQNADSSAEVPAIGSTITVPVLNSSWMAIGQPVFVQTIGMFRVTSIPTSTSVELYNLGYSENLPPATVFPDQAKIVPGGWKGNAYAGSGPYVSGSMAITPGLVDPATGQFTVSVVPDMAGIPLVIDVTLRKPAGGDDFLITLIDGLVTVNSFVVALGAVPPTSGYFVDYVAIMP